MTPENIAAQSLSPVWPLGGLQDDRPVLGQRLRSLPGVRIALAAALMFVGGVTAGVLWSHASRWPEETYLDLRATVREVTGLSKHWHALPKMIGTHLKVACPDPAKALVIVTGGQSNSANANSSPSASQPGQGAFDWYGGACYVSQDPVPGATGTKGSLWPEIGVDLAQRLDRPVLMIHGGIGGSQIADWLDDRSGYLASLTTQIAGARAAGFEPDLVLWHQGETDAARHPDRKALAGRLGALMDRLLTELPAAEVYLFQASKCVGRKREEGVEAVRAAQKEIAASRQMVVAGFDTDSLGNDYRWDTCHFNSLGRDAIRKAIGPDLARLASRH
jgi:hypothetical protein